MHLKDINCVMTRNTKIEDIENFGTAQFNLILTNEDLPLFTKEAERLGVSNFGADLPLPYGLKNTEEIYKNFFFALTTICPYFCDPP
ncbi:MAG: hypothetical protein ACETWK_07410 [Candidatus Aminicenantaceae bacterium]